MKHSFTALSRALAACVSALLFVSGSALAQQVSADVNFPDTPTQIITMDDGSELHKYSARVVRTRGSQLTVRYGDNLEEYRYSVPASFRFEMDDGRRVGVRDLGEGDMLNVYVKHEPGADSMFYEYDQSAGTAAAAMGASTAAVTAAEPAPSSTAMLPSTASPLPLIGMLGALFVSLGGLGFAIRRRLS